MIQYNFSNDDYEIVKFTNQIDPRLHVRPMYFELGFSPETTIYGRTAVLKGLMKALALIPQEYGLLIWDVYRPRAVQAALFNWMHKEIQIKYPHLTEAELFEETKKYVALPAEIGNDYCSPHLSGGAIDLTLCEADSGRELDMGTPFDDCSERAHLGYFSQKSHLSPAEKEIKKRRELLRSTMESVGFTSYQYEWWHFDIGNFFWSQKLGCAEAFGPLFGDKEWPSS
ncbi:D-alanyl-D-alanine dipeptidase [Legionella massiliensis]|uniref:D-alanyl-D-alanine dipeptidase n=1 Tax=Legionella massiliensis TaxID=1034943 RepID=A0A078L2H5_9GAMM|nr:M15 family metallopeptidase [Legionella massiliensis]CDZ78203.1 D-alanyl-D-alanine dipeptidase [Legionella massiliensis]CEE13941.1 D-alanyl-D-alanine dipeptidase [Legionella massiliensis]